VIFDYPRRRLRLEPNAHQLEPFDSLTSGFGLETGGRDFKTLKVRGIIANSPAADAGLRDADIIT
jgi:S1-C subfamily serine protease